VAIHKSMPSTWLYMLPKSMSVLRFHYERNTPLQTPQHQCLTAGLVNAMRTLIRVNTLRCNNSRRRCVAEKAESEVTVKAIRSVVHECLSSETAIRRIQQTAEQRCAMRCPRQQELRTQQSVGAQGHIHVPLRHAKNPLCTEFITKWFETLL